jgi:hypothetical protein
MRDSSCPSSPTICEPPTTSTRARSTCGDPCREWLRLVYLAGRCGCADMRYAVDSIRGRPPRLQTTNDSSEEATLEIEVTVGDVPDRPSDA